MEESAEGSLQCPECKNYLSAEDYEPFSIEPCPECGVPFLVPGFIAGYWLYEPLGGGGECSVIKACHAETGEFCAMKILHRDKRTDVDAVVAMEREVETLGQIEEHPNIASVICSGKEGDEYYCAQELIEGSRLDHFAAMAQGLPQEMALGIVLDLIDVDRHIHEHDLLYRDMKPENIIIHDKRGPVLFDFGLCIPLEVAENPDFDGTFEGSALFVPPERLIGHPEGPWSEIYSLGMLLYEMLANKPLLKSSVSSDDLLKKHLSGLRVKVSGSQIPDCHPAIAQIIEKMINRDPNDRIQTFDEAEEVLREVAGT
jgi:serine/threonine protein kinase